MFKQKVQIFAWTVLINWSLVMASDETRWDMECILSFEKALGCENSEFQIFHSKLIKLTTSIINQAFKMGIKKRFQWLVLILRVNEPFIFLNNLFSNIKNNFRIIIFTEKQLAVYKKLLFQLGSQLFHSYFSSPPQVHHPLARNRIRCCGIINTFKFNCRISMLSVWKRVLIFFPRFQNGLRHIVQMDVFPNDDKNFP